MVSIAVGTVAARPHEVLEDVWVGEEGTPFQSEAFTFTAPPAPDLLSAYLHADEDDRTEHIVTAKFAWLREGFSRELNEEDEPWQWDEIQGRIADPNDPLRTSHLFGLYDALMEAVATRPPTSSPRSTAARRPKTGGAKPKPKGTTSGA